MLDFWKRIFGGSKRPPGITMVDDELRACAEQIRRCVVAQFEEAGVPLMTSTFPHRSLVLGYVATLAEEMGSHLHRDDLQSASMLMCFLAMNGIDAEPNPEALMREFTELTATREYSFGQGGAIALEDFPLVALDASPRGLAVELNGSKWR